MKLNSAVCLTALLAFLPSSAFAGICFLPDCMDEDVVQGDFNMNINEDTEFCEKEGYTYYASGKCPQYYAVVGTCSRDDHYLKCDAATWCKQNGYNTTSCSLPSFVDEQCPNGQPYYKQCTEDRPRACREAGYVNSCSPGRLYATSNRCPWDSSYGKCCTASPSSGCPSNYEVGCSGSASGTDACGYTCYRCCSDTCSSGSKNYSGDIAGYTECGTPCYKCNDCTSGSTSYSGDYVGSSECGSCYACSDTCRTGSASVNCSSTQNKTKVSTTECGTPCYSCEYNTDCDAEDKSCTYGCSSYNSCGKCTACGSNPDCDATDLSCPDFGCANTNSCGKCIACNGDPCDSVTAVTPPANASCSSYYSTCSSKCSAWTCNSGYTKSGDSCVEECTDTCSSKGYQTSQPSGQTCSTTTVCGQTCYYNCQSNCTYTLTASDCSNQCKNTSGASCTKNGTTYYQSCGSSKCKDGETCSGGQCVSTCTDTCSSKGYKTSQPSGYTCSTTSVCGQTCYKDCVCATTCEDKVTSKPANSSYTTESCTACGSTKTINTGWTCNDGYEKSGNSCVEQCVPDPDCKAPAGYASLSSCPAHGACDYCEPGCGKARIYWLADGCDSGYEVNAAGTGCEEITCDYTKTAKDCSAQCKNVGSLSCKRDGTTYYQSCGSSKCSGSTPYCNMDGKCVQCVSDSQCPSSKPHCNSSGSCVECEYDSHCPTMQRCMSNTCEWDLDDNCDGNYGQEYICSQTSSKLTVCCCPKGKSCGDYNCDCYDVSF